MVAIQERPTLTSNLVNLKSTRDIKHSEVWWKMVVSQILTFSITEFCWNK